MNLRENLHEALRAIKANSLRSVLTALIITIGIMALVGILTAIDGLQSSIDSSFEGLGATTFDIQRIEKKGRRSGIIRKQTPAVSIRQANEFQNLFLKKGNDATMSISSTVSGSAQVKSETKETNPNSIIIGTDSYYIGVKGFQVQEGRNLTPKDVELSSNAGVIGFDIAKFLFPNESALDKNIVVMGQKIHVVGILQLKKSMTGGEDNRIVLVPLETGRQMAGQRAVTFTITASVKDMTKMETANGDAISLMRQVRGDRLGEENSFEIVKADDLARRLDGVTGGMRAGGFGISIITLLGAAIALMNIMMVSVTERTREIGIRKSLGATPSKIRIQFLIEAIVICLLGGLTGVLLGIGIGNVIAGFISPEGGKFIIPWAWIALGLVVCIVVGLISGIYPAYKASKLDPIESLRYE